ncbi:hypothetical protein BHE74_00052912 [Ensete ventricosum]|nr:hypothetical protein BHE74_00052912 [Ensete ventricosum]
MTEESTSLGPARVCKSVHIGRGVVSERVASIYFGILVSVCGRSYARPYLRRCARHDRLVRLTTFRSVGVVGRRTVRMERRKGATCHPSLTRSSGLDWLVGKVVSGATSIAPTELYVGS